MLVADAIPLYQEADVINQFWQLNQFIVRVRKGSQWTYSNSVGIPICIIYFILVLLTLHAIVSSHLHLHPIHTHTLIKPTIYKFRAKMADNQNSLPSIEDVVECRLYPEVTDEQELLICAMKYSDFMKKLTCDYIWYHEELRISVSRECMDL